MKKLIISIAILQGLLITSCTKDISSYNDETKRAANVPAGTLFSNATRNLSDNLVSASVNTNPFRFIVKHWSMATYQDEAQFDFSTRNIPQTWWGAMYRDVLTDYKESAKIITDDATLLEGEKANKLAIVDIMQVYVFANLVTTFGDIPYSQALDPGNVYPVYDDAKTVYSDLLSRLAADISALNTDNKGFSSSEDFLYAGSVSKWKKFANTLRFKLGMILADSDAATAKANVEAADAGAFTSSDDDGLMPYLSATPNTNPLYADIILGGRGDYLAAEDLMDPLIDLNDPRKSLYFGTNNDGEYVGGVVGAGNTYSTTSKPSAQVSAADAPGIFLTYSELEFYRAEAIERGFTVAGTAAEHYTNGIKASILDWGGSAGDATTYLAQPEVAYATATGTWKEKIAFQKWIALYNRPMDGWLELRRLDYPELTLPVGAKSGFPVRYQYPNNEQQLNPANYTSAASKIGGDEVETKLFWDAN
ncbi:SusD/RagB family nutrient-binding outer membrane lipoprotein [Terrimonas sp.]|uniref:SusD/RagB family nutrient-binding outer membrane lipoprotein n=1 Tax=Terrimonas sp. TaxID=1914338 RepID=UPI000D513A20|nr:SusD/RagB family nutrient-binding outer membrane lipoprotein [Terrimonas sp.]PVD52107.1 SusD/RagB family nutrient-binding outer membrane lipoprotein [Terrimonas sp.]